MPNTMTRPQMPRKVLAKAVQLGVHNDCLVGDADNACRPCLELIHLSFDYFYADSASLSDLMDSILSDLEADREEDLS